MTDVDLDNYNNEVDDNEECKSLEEPKTIKETIEVPAHIISELPKVLDYIRSLEMSQENHQMMEYRGPLPYQVIENLDKEQKDKLIEDMVESKKRDQDTQRKFIELSHQNEERKRKHGFNKLIVSAAFLLVLYFGSVFTDSVDSLLSIIPLVSALAGGAGVGVIYMYKKIKEDDE